MTCSRPFTNGCESGSFLASGLFSKELFSFGVPDPLIRAHEGPEAGLSEPDEDEGPSAEKKDEVVEVDRSEGQSESGEPNEVEEEELMKAG